jgi:hypothetical protein
LENTREEFEKLVPIYRKQLPKECQNCGSTDNIHIHHIVPLYVGGTNKLTNMASLCGKCHEIIHGLEEGQFVMLKDGLQLYRKSGKTTKAPFGYDLVGGELSPSKDADLVREIFRLRLVHKYSFVAIAETLNELGVQPPKGSKWTGHVMYNRWFKNRVYFGVIEYRGEAVASFDDYIMKDEPYTWEDVENHNALGKGEKRVLYSNKDEYTLMRKLLPYVKDKRKAKGFISKVESKYLKR